MEPLIVNLKRTDDRVHFECASASHPDLVVPLDYTPPLGSGNGLAGLEALLIAFSGCVSTAIVGLLLRLGRHVLDYSATAEGVRTEQPLTLSEIHFQIAIKSKDVTAEDMRAVLRQAEAISPVWLAIKNNVLVKTSYTLI
ncbi:MAG: OsmC family protein [Clostridiales bacterium]|nr:OsmC family protein [Clostridiales bacterium]